MNSSRLTSLIMVAAAATLGMATGCSSSSKSGTGGVGGGVVGLGGKTGTAGMAGSVGGSTGLGGSTSGGGSTGTAGGAGGSTGTAGAAGGSTGTAGGASGSTGTAGAAGGATAVGGSMGTAGAAGGTTGMAGAAGGSTGAGGGAGAGGATGPSTLLVDNDASDNNFDSTAALSASDMLFSTRLAAEHIPFDTYVVPGASTPTTPTYTQLLPYATLVWYTADASSELLTASQENTLENWLDLGGKTLLIFSENLFYDIGTGGDWTSTNADTFLTSYLGAAGWAPDSYYVTGGTDASLEDVTYTVAGAAGTPFANLQFTVIASTPLESDDDVVNPATGTVTLATIQADPESTGTANIAAPIAVAHTKGTSKIVYVGFPVENIQGPPTNTSADFIHAVLKSVALVP